MQTNDRRKLSEELGIPYIESIEDDIDQELIAKLPIAFAKAHEIIPLKEESGHIVVAASNPLIMEPIDDLRLIYGKEVSLLVTEPLTIQNEINKQYAVGADSAEAAMTDLEDKETLETIAIELEEPKDILDMSDEAPIIRLINTLLHQAVKDRASDIHIEPYESSLTVRFRIDGILYNIISPPKRYQPFIVSRIKVMSGLNIAEKRLPQDGRIRVRIAGDDIDIRVSTVPTSFGERLVLRILERNIAKLNLDNIGLSDSCYQNMNKLIRQSYGVLLVTGPTGSGKTTTLYAALTEINNNDKNIITVEDPVEYQLHGIGQIQVNPKINLTFASGLRSILRQDPDVIMIGEIRDTETADISIHAALTGHLVFSTLHTNDSAGAVTRLVDMGIEPFLISSSVSAVLAQRLVRILCKSCRIEYTPSEAELGSLNSPQLRGKGIYKAAGCPECKNTGYRGRTGIYELLIIDNDLRGLINKNSAANEIKRMALEKGMHSLKDAGIDKVVKGITGIEEIVRVTKSDLEL